MKRIPRWLLNGLTILSLPLFAATVVLWVRSYSRFDGVNIFRPRRPAMRISVGQGGFTVTRFNYPGAKRETTFTTWPASAVSSPMLGKV